MAGARWIVLAVVGMLVASVATGCGSSRGGGGNGGGGSKPITVTLVSPGSANDVDWTALGLTVVRELSRRLGVRSEVVTAPSGSAVAGTLERVSHDGSKLVIANDGRYAEAAGVAAEKTRVPELVWGEQHPPAPTPIAGITLQDKEGGYLAGVLAAHASYTRRLGIVLVDDGSPWDRQWRSRMAGGFVAGARSVDPHERIAFTVVGGSGSGGGGSGSGGSATPLQAERAVHRLVVHGSQIVFGLGGRSGPAMLRALERYEHAHLGEHLYVGVIGDKHTIDKETVVLTSVLWNFRPVFQQAVRDVRARRFGKEGDYELTLANGGISLLQTPRTPSDAYAAAMAAKATMGEVPTSSYTAEVQELIEGKQI
jgi:basic membrane lipoprotein Med (substrate-binding protein (PBP1-ABC) superfamily)